MNRPDQALGKLAAACAAAILVLSPTWAPAQKVILEPVPDGARIVVPGVPADLARERTARTSTTVRVDVVLPASKVMTPVPGMAAANPGKVARQDFEQLRPTFERELRLLTSVARPTPSQRREIAIEAGSKLRETVDREAKRFNVPQATMIQVILPGSTKLVRQHLQAAAAGKLDDEQSARYRAELGRKEEDRKEVEVLIIAANLEWQLILSPSQREKLCESLRKFSGERELPLLENSQVYDLYYPMFFDRVVVPWLDEQQMKVYRNLRKNHTESLRAASPASLALAVEFEDKDRDEDVMAAFGEEVKQ